MDSNDKTDDGSQSTHDVDNDNLIGKITHHETSPDSNAVSAAQENIKEMSNTPDLTEAEKANLAPEHTLPPIQKHHRDWTKYILAALLIILAFAIGVFGTLLLTKNNQRSSQTNTPRQTSEASSSNATESKTPVTPVKDAAVWLETPQKMAIQPVFTDQWFKDSYQSAEPPVKIEDVLSFYKIGSINSDDLIIASVSDGPFGYTLLFKKSGNSYTLYQQHSNAFYSNTEGAQPEYQGPGLTAAVKIDKTSQIADIVAPNSIKIGEQSFTVSQNGALGVDFIATKAPTNDYLNYVVSKTIPEGTIYEAVTKDEAAYKVSYYTLMTKDHRMHPYVMDGAIFNMNNTVQPITWNGGIKNTLAYASAVGGCSFSQATEIGKNLKEDNLVVSGKSAEGANVYMLKDVNHPLLLKHYEEYKEITKYNNTLPTEENNLTIEQFKQKNGIYIAKDGIGRWIVMTNPNYFPSGGCAKPVVYLYPTVATITNVSVGANVTLSDPLYPAGGWKAVLAHADGSLLYQGKPYESLFWEGYGKGAYPEITAGTFVKLSDVEQKIRSDLTIQGLNAKEINDFWAFWSTKVPQKNYVRLTWFSKQQLQTLAPLYVAPRPDTVIRVFLDMEGVDEPYALAPQKFITPKRNGFTVVEWGGLARDGSVPKLK